MAFLVKNGNECMSVSLEELVSSMISERRNKE